MLIKHLNDKQHNNYADTIAVGFSAWLRGLREWCLVSVL